MSTITKFVILNLEHYRMSNQVVIPRVQQQIVIPAQPIQGQGQQQMVIPHQAVQLNTSSNER